MRRNIPFSRRGLLAAFAAAALCLVLLAACGVEDPEPEAQPSATATTGPTTSAAAESEPADATTPAPTEVPATPEPTDVPIVVLPRATEESAAQYPQPPLRLIQLRRRLPPQPLRGLTRLQSQPPRRLHRRSPARAPGAARSETALPNSRAPRNGSTESHSPWRASWARLC